MTFPIRARSLRTRLLLSACFVALPTAAHAQNTTIASGTTKTSNTNLDADDTLTVEAGGTIQVTGNRAVTINGASTGTGIVITNNGTIEGVPNSATNGRGISGTGGAASGGTPAPVWERTLTINNSGVIRGANDAIQITATAADTGVITITNSGTILSTGATNAAGIGQVAQGVEVTIPGATLNLTNAAGGSITGNEGVLTSATSTIVNAGTITGTGAVVQTGTNSSGDPVYNASQGEGIRANGTLTLTNEAGGVITGVYGVIGTGNTTIVNRGTISGGEGGLTTSTLTREAIRVNLSATSTTNSITLAAGSVTSAGTGSNASGAAVTFGGSAANVAPGTVNTVTIETGAVINGSITAASSVNATDILNLTGTGAQVLGVATGFDTLNVQGGTWGITNGQTLRNGATIAAGATLRYDDSGSSGGSVAGAIVNNGTLIQNRTSTVTNTGTISGTGGVQIVNTGQLVLFGQNSYQGDTLVSNGRLRSGMTDNSFSASSALIVTDLGVVDMTDTTTTLVDGVSTSTPVARNQIVANISGNGSIRTSSGASGGAILTTGSGGGNTEFSGVISGLGGLTKVGSGTLMLSGANTASGQLSVTGGTVALTRWSGATSVTNGATLTGAARIYGVLSVGNGTLAPGNNGIGTLNVDGLVLSADSVLNYDLAAPGTGDRIQVNGDLTLDGTLNINDVGGFGEGVYRLVNYSGALTDNGLVIGGVPAGANAGLMTIQTSVATQVNLVYGTPAATTIQFWDGTDNSGDGTVQGGSGSWTNGFPNWTDAAATDNSGWAGAFGVFQGAAGVVTVDDAILFTGAQFMTDGYEIAGGSGTLTTNSALTNIRVDPGVTATISAGVGGTGGLLKNDAGTLILSGANSYGGNTTILGGTVVVLGGAAIPVTSSVSVATGATLDVRADQAIGGLTGSGAVLLSGGALTTGALGGNDSFTGTIDGAGGLIKTGTGTTTLGGANSYAGGTSVQAGTLALASGGTLGQGDLDITGAGTVDLGGHATSIGALSGAGTLQLGAGGALTTSSTANSSFTGTIHGAGASLTKAGSGTLTLGGINDYGALDIAGGRVVAGTAGALGGSTSVTVNGGALELGASQSVAALNGGGDVALNGNRLTIGGGSYAGVASGTGGITVVGNVTLSGANAYGGRTSVASGTLVLSGSVAGGVDVASGATLNGIGSAAGTVNLAGGATLEIGSGASAGNFTTGGLALSSGSTLAFGLGAAGVAGASDHIQVNGDLVLDGTLNVTDIGGFGVGVYRLIDYTGALTDNGLELGTLPAGTNRTRTQVQTAIGSQVNLVVADSLPEVQFWNGANSSSNGTIEGGSGSWTVGRAAWSDANGAGNDSWGGRFAVFQGAAGTVIVDDAIEFSGMQFMTDGYVIAAGTGTLSAIEAQTNIRVDPGVTATIAAGIGGSGGLNKLDTGTLILTGANSYAGATTVAGGTLRAGGVGSLPTNTAVTVAAGATLDIAAAQTIASLAGAGSVTLSGGGLTTGGDDSSTRFAGIISGEGSLTKTGSGTFTLAGANSYAGGTSIQGGTLRLDGGTIGGGDLAVAAGGTFDLNGGNASVAALGGAGSILLGSGTLSAGGTADSSFGGVISGEGGLVKIGSGNLTLTGANLYTGLTSVRGGTLTIGSGILPTGGAVAIDAGAALALTGAVTLGNLAGAGNVALAANTLTLAAGNYAGVIAGTGGLTKTGTGVLTLTGANLYSGATNVSGGTLAIGAGGSIAGSSGVALSGGASLNIAAAASSQVLAGLTGVAGTSVVLGGNQLVVNNGTANSFAGLISGAGSLGKSGAGTLTLGAANTHSGGTVVAGGTLVAGVANAFGSGVLTVTAPGTVNLANFATTVGGLAGDGNIALGSAVLTVNSTGSTAYSGVLSGSGRLIKSGAGTLTLNGANSYTGSTTINEGLLVVNGSLAGTLTIGANGRLGGSGRTGSLSVGGIVAPGNSIGTLNVAGSLTLAAGSTYQVEVSPTGISDQIIATGAVTINGGTVSVLTGGATNFLPLTTYTILSGSSVTGTFGSVVTDLAFLTPSLVYNAANVQLRLLRNDVSLGAVAQTSNQVAVAAAVSAQSSGGVFDAVIGLNAADARTAFDQLSGEVFTAGLAVAGRDGHDAARELLARADAPRGQPKSFWIAGDIGQMSAGARSGHAEIESDRQTVSAGVEVTGDTLRYGFAYRYARNDIRLDARGSEGVLVSNSAYAYFGYTLGGLRIAGGVGYAKHALSTDRRVAFGGLSNRLTSDGDGKSFSSFGEAAWLVPVGKALQVGPYAGASVTSVRFDRVREWGGAAALVAGKARSTTTLASYGLRGAAVIDGITLSGDIGGRSYLDDPEARRNFAFVDTGNGFEAGSGQFGKTTISGRFDASAAVGRFVLGVGLRGESGSGGSSYGVRASAGFRF
ncbi:autotransporter-associated beta strand repeat-containing protein [Sphingomonas sp. Sphisp140]|uniref:autotransporter-associated beta strand repeat-containing protein n=1 Tax=unclassified Sphingomonas TaxID=196159 RepID=UPI0039AECDCD